MTLKRSLDPEYTFRGIIKCISYINKNSAVYYMRDSLHMPMGEVITSMFNVIHLCILHDALPKSFMYWKVFIYISFPGVILPMHLNYICVCICIFVHHTKVSLLIHLCMLYYIIIVYTSPWYFFYISPVHCLFHHYTILTYVFVLIFLLIFYIFLL